MCVSIGSWRACRISPEDLGIWGQQHVGPLRRIVDFHHSQGALAGIQLAHSGRKASTYAPWLTDGLISKPPIDVKGHVAVPPEAGGWLDVWAPSAIPFNEQHADPHEMTLEQIEEVTQAFVDSTRRADEAGYDVVESAFAFGVLRSSPLLSERTVHGAHGYLLTSFVSPLSNTRTDKYGGSLENRIRLPLEVARAVRKVWPASKPLFFRISATEYYEKGEKDEKGEWISWGIEQSKILARHVRFHSCSICWKVLK